MKSFLILIFFMSLAPQSYALNLGQEDKQQHMALSGAISGPAYYTMRSKNFSRAQSASFAILLTLVTGHLKESGDARYDTDDMKANTLGAIGGIVLPLHFTF